MHIQCKISSIIEECRRTPFKFNKKHCRFYVIKIARYVAHLNNGHIHYSLTFSLDFAKFFGDNWNGNKGVQKHAVLFSRYIFNFCLVAFPSNPQQLSLGKINCDFQCICGDWKSFPYFVLCSGVSCRLDLLPLRRLL